MKRKMSLKALYIVVISIVVIILVILGYKEFSRKVTQTIMPNDKYINSEIDEDTQKQLSDVEELVIQKMNAAMIPGLSVAIVKEGETVYKSGFGYADLASGKEVTSDTLFQLGSNSKAFTALGVFQLQKDGLIDVKDSITKYIPWLKLFYEDKETNVTIEDFLHHTSGIPSNTINKIPQLDEENKDAIEKTVRTIVGLHLVNKPGDKYEYVTINYDVLGLLIEKISGIKYEDYIQKYVLDPGGLINTYMFRSQADNHEMASGYKIGFFSPKYYKAPRYEGNKPAGYIISNANDMAEWLKIQLGTCISSTLDSDLVEESHKPGVETFGTEMYYAAGWNVFNNDGTEIYHGGRNPNYSSYIVFRPDDKFGVAVLCNIKSNNTMDIGESILELFVHNKKSSGIIADENIALDKVCAVIIFIAIPTLCLLIGLLIHLVFQFAGKKQKLNLTDKKQILKCLILLSIFLLVCIILYFLPYFLFNKAIWSFIFIWYPSTVKIALYSIYICLALLNIYIALKLLGKNKMIN